MGHILDRADPSDKSTPPSYDRVSIPGDDGTELLVFRAAPPYEDVAFRIVRKQWDYSHRRGFRSHFDRGVLQRELVCVRADTSRVQVPARHVPQVSGEWSEQVLSAPGRQAQSDARATRPAAPSLPDVVSSVCWHVCLLPPVSPAGRHICTDARPSTSMRNGLVLQMFGSEICAPQRHPLGWQTRCLRAFAGLHTRIAAGKDADAQSPASRDGDLVTCDLCMESGMRQDAGLGGADEGAPDGIASHHLTRPLTVLHRIPHRASACTAQRHPLCARYALHTRRTEQHRECECACACAHAARRCPQAVA